MARAFSQRGGTTTTTGDTTNTQFSQTGGFNTGGAGTGNYSTYADTGVRPPPPNYDAGAFGSNNKSGPMNMDAGGSPTPFMPYAGPGLGQGGMPNPYGGSGVGLNQNSYGLTPYLNNIRLQLIANGYYLPWLQNRQ